ncbi:MAG: flagellar motor switch phosphatase FliY [Bacillota bacterium]
MSQTFLSQEEIDALLRQNIDDHSIKTSAFPDLNQELTFEERDALGEIGNISMGSASTALSTIINQRVNITTPHVRICNVEELPGLFTFPSIIIEVNYTEGLFGVNILVVQGEDAAVIADLMMGGTGIGTDGTLSAMAVSAVGEAMNQMIGAAATSMSTFFQKVIKISPPKATIINGMDEVLQTLSVPPVDNLVIVGFKIEIGDLVNSELIQVIPLRIAKEQAALLLQPAQDNSPVLMPTLVEQQPEQSKQEEVTPVEAAATTAGPDRGYVSTSKFEGRNIDLILDVPLEITVILGKTRRQIKEVLSFVPGAIVELEKLADEPVEILVNGTLVAQGEVVVINENFGVRVKNIASPLERINNLRR